MAEFNSAIQGRSVHTQQTTFVRYDFNVDDYQHGQEVLVSPANIPVGAILLRYYVAVKTPLDYPSDSSKHFQINADIGDSRVASVDIAKTGSAGVYPVTISGNYFWERDRPIIFSIDDDGETYSKGEFSVILEFVTAR